MFLVECQHNKWDKATLIPIIRKHLKPGTLIITVAWKAYMSLPNYGYCHEKIMYSYGKIIITCLFIQML